MVEISFVQKLVWLLITLEAQHVPTSFRAVQNNHEAWVNSS